RRIIDFMFYFICYIILINSLTFLLYGNDKRRAQKGSFRISEATLMGLALVGGSVGAFLGMQVYRHKTRHVKFVIGIPLIFFIQVFIAIKILDI
ncbi:MAG: DUF1294 domain-containing protein, partial [Lachnospiraceae bacterium]